MAEAEEKLVLKPGVVTQFLDNFSSTPDLESFQFTELNITNKRVEQLNKAMEEVKDVAIVDFSLNNITDINPMKDMANLVKLNLAKNKIKSLAVFTLEECFPNLKWLDVQANKFSEMPALKLPKLEYLDISYNKLEKLNEGWTGHANLRIVKSVDNKFKSLAAFKNMPRLEELYMASNSISNLTGWESLPVLKKLHLRRNKIEKIEEELPELPAIQYINLRSNKIPNMEVLERLYQFPTLVDINVLNNPVESNATSFNLLIAEVLIKNVKIQRFCKQPIEESHKLEGWYLAQYRHEKERHEKKLKEEEERRREAEGNEDDD